MIKFILLPKQKELETIEGKTFDYVFIDLKNALPMIFDEKIAMHILENPMYAFSEFLATILNAMFYLRSHIKFGSLIFFCETGQSVYHKKYLKTYKSNRYQSWVLLKENEKQSYLKVLQNIFEALVKFLNRIPNTYAFMLRYFEADFIPHFIVNKQNTCNALILSNDKDLLQCVNENTWVYRKVSSKFITRIQDAHKELLPDVTYDKTNLIAEILSILGDSSDGIPGVKGIGPKTLTHLIDILQPENLNDFFQKAPNTTNKRILNAYKKLIANESIIRRNYKLIAFSEIEKNLPVSILDEIDSIFATQKYPLTKIQTLLSKFGISTDLPMLEKLVES